MPHSRWTLLLPALLGLGLALAIAPFTRFQLDDWLILDAIRAGRLDVYRFSDGDPEVARSAMQAGLLPWFADPELKLAFFRPLTGLSLALDHALAGAHPLLGALHSAAWFTALCALVTALFRLTLPRRQVLPAALLFAIAGVHVQGLAWLSARNVLICATLGVAGILAHVLWRQGGAPWLRRGAGLLAPVLLAGGLLGGEAGVGPLAYIVAYELIARQDALGRRAAALLPTLLVAGGWLTLVLAADAGVHGSGAYIHPLADPVDFVLAMPARLAFGAGVLLAGTSADTWTLYPDQHALLALVGGLAALPLAAWAGSTLRHLEADERRAFGWLTLGAGLALLPQLAGLLGSRSFVVPTVGASALVALLLLDGLSKEGGGLLFRRIGTGVLAIGHVGFALAQWWIVPSALHDNRVQTDAAWASLRSLDLPPGPGLLLAVPTVEAATHARSQARVLGVDTPHTLPLTLGPRALHVTRTAPDTWRVALLDGTWLDGELGRVYRDGGTLDVGLTVDLDDVVIHVIEARGGEATTLEVTAPPGTPWLTWDGTAMVPVTLDVGEDVRLVPEG